MKNLCMHHGRQLLTVLSLLLSPVLLKAQQAAFTYNATPVNLCAPVSVAFHNTSTGTPLSLVWDFGNGRSSREANPVISFDAPGPVTVTLTAYYSTNTSSVSQSLTIYPAPAVDFTVNNRYACGPYTATFTDLTPGGQQRTWDFGDGTPPVTTSAATVQHQYTRIDTFNVSLTVSNANGCTQTLRKEGFIQMAAPEISLSDIGLQGCVPFDATFNATVNTINNDAVTACAWNFGDNSSDNSTTPSITHRYTNTGNHTVSLTVTTQQGCTATRSFQQLVKTGVPPQNVSFTATRTNDCAGTSTRLLASAINADDYRWDFGDGTTLEGPEHDVNHVFRTGGNVTVQLAAGSNGCYTSAAPVTLSNQGPVANFTFQRRCDNKMAFDFTNISTGAGSDTYEWDFDDGSPLDNSAHPRHIYTTGGTYTVRLTVRNAAQTCTSTYFQTIQVFTADFHTGVGTICRSSEVPYGVVHVPNTLVETYDWRFGDGSVLTTTEDDIRKTVHTTGVFTDMLIIRYKDPAYCPDTIIKQNHLTVIAPQAALTVTGNACEGQPVNFQQTSVPSPNIPLTEWQWDLGNGTRSALQTPAATMYNASGTFPVKLVVTDARNCKDSTTINITVRPTPIVHALTPQAKICEGNTVTLQGISNAPVRWERPYQISCLNCSNPDVTPLRDTSYIAVATNIYGCTARDTVAIQVVPDVHLTVSADTSICSGMHAQLRAYGAAAYTWTPDDATITGANTAMPVVMPEVNSTYTVSASNDPSCPAATAQINVAVRPVPEVNAGADQVVTVGSIVQLTPTYSSDVVHLEWKPATYLDCASCPETVAAPRQSMDYALEVTNHVGCKRTDIMNIKLVCDQSVVFFPNGFSPNGDGMNDVFYARGKGIRTVKSFRIYNRLGQEVFRRENFNVEDMAMGWDGTFNGRALAADVYIYMAELLCDSNETFHLKGNVTLLR
ncbi:PKD domain-containing protein [Chitinophaga cymbidii]|nr:PKD domain-containing protein [Chitinophaga cymbidii]